MAPSSPESHFDPLSKGEGLETVPASRPLRVTLDTQLESGIPPARLGCESEPAAPFGADLPPGHASDVDLPLGLPLGLEHGVQRMEAALDNAQRTEANLGSLLRGLKHLASGAEAARIANTELLLELDELRTHLSRSQQEEHALRFRMSQLEQLLSVIRHDNARERTFLLEEQDRFLNEILTDHERQLSELRQSLRGSSSEASHVHEIEELIVQRDQAREYATRCERERDLAWQELATGAAAPSIGGLAAAEPIQRSPSGAAAIGSIGLRTVAVPAPSADPGNERARERFTTSTGYSMSRDDISE